MMDIESLHCVAIRSKGYDDLSTLALPLIDLPNLIAPTRPNRILTEFQPFYAIIPQKHIEVKIDSKLIKLIFF